MNRPRTVLAVAAAIVLFAGVGVVTTMLLTPDAQTLSIRSAAAITLPGPAAEVAGDVDEDATRASNGACPELTNPGGLRWRPSPDAGPWPTDGSVSLTSLGVQAPVVRVGVDRSGQMVVPRNARDIAWLDQGGVPGDTQNVVLAGHISYAKHAGSFFRLREMQPGDVVSLSLHGKQLDFRVTWACLFDRDTELASKIMGRTDVPSITLISCGGTFDRAAGTHTKRVAVRGELLNA